MGLYEDFDEQKQFACRVIADHARTTAFAISDGILPGNEGRNYVLRKIMRRAIYHGREHLGFEGLFFHKVCDFVVGEMKDAYPELETQQEFIGKMVRLEEERFGNTLTVGLKRLNELLKDRSTTEIQQLIDQKFKAQLEGKSSNEIELLSEKINLKIQSKSESEINNNKSLAQISFVDKIAPSTIKMIMETKYPDDSFDMNYFCVELVNNINVSGTEKEKELVSLFDKQEYKTFIESLDSFYEATGFDNFAKLYDTYGVPRDLIRLKLEEKIEESISEETFENMFDESLERLQSQGNIGKTQQNEKINPIYKSLEDEGFASNFQGYELTEVEDAKVVAIVKGDEKVDELSEGEEGLIVLDETPFYAESGGQVGDRGTLVSTVRVSGLGNAENSDDDAKAPAHAGSTDQKADKLAIVNVIDTFAPIAGIVLHKSKIKSGTIKVGDKVTATVDVEKRDAIRRNHTATHLVHSALKEVLGTHVKQAGSVVSPNYLRFDFTHYQAMSDAELQEIEDLVNGYILQNEPVATDLMSIDDAMKTGAVAMFGEKYGSDVRVLSVGNGEFSRELCGGTHVRATGDIGSFKITADEAIASGVRRIRAITGFDAFKRFRDDEILIDESLNVLNTQRDNLPNAIAKLQDELKQKRKEVDELKLKIATGAVGGPSTDDEAREINGVKVIAKSVEDLDKGGMRHLSDTLMAQVKSGVVIIGNKNDGKVSFIVRVSDDLTKKVRAGNIIKEIAPIVGGRGGGRPDMAEGGGTEPEKLSEAMDASYGVIEKMLE